MKKKVENKKVFTASDFIEATTSVSIAPCFWVIDNVSCTNVGDYSKYPLFELQLKRVQPKREIADADQDLDGLVDMSYKMAPNKTYYVRDGRPLFNEFAVIWDGLCGDREDFRAAILNTYKDGAFRGRVETLVGVTYTKSTPHGTIVQKTRADFWYPDYVEEGYIMDDFVYLCNKGVYTPVIPETPTVDPMDEVISKLDPALVQAILAKKK